MNAPMKFSILSEMTRSSDTQVKHAGKIRPGIKVLTAAAAKNPAAVQLYREGTAQRLKFSEIEKMIKDKTSLENPMYPRNVPYFTVAASDFGMPEIASRIIHLYGEKRDGDDEVRLYRFPVVFHTDELNQIYPNEFKRHGGERSYESHYGDDGIRYCRYLPELSEEQLAAIRTRRIKRMPPREKVKRGECNPGECHEFQQGQCRFRGRLMFYIPQIPTTGLLVMETTSTYAAETIWTDLQRILDVLGTIPRMNPIKPESPVFYITKVLESRTYFDEHGKKKTGNQWVPKLQADIDMGALLQSGRTHALPAPSTPVAWLAAPKGMPTAEVLPPADLPGENAGASARGSTGQGTDGSIDPDDELAQLIDAMGLEDNLVAQYFDIKIGTEWENDAAAVVKAIQMLKDMSKVGNRCVSKLISIAVKVASMQIDMQKFNHYMFGKYGRGYTSKEHVLAEIEAEVDVFGTWPPGVAMTYIADALAPA